MEDAIALVDCSCGSRAPACAPGSRIIAARRAGQGGREAGHVVLPRHQPQHHDQDDGHGRGQRLAYDDVVAFALDNATT